MTKPYRFVEDVFTDVRELRDRLKTQGDQEGARVLDDVLRRSIANPVEAVNEIIEALEQIRPESVRILPPADAEMLDRLLEGAKRLYGTPYH
jgi:hypothetical protein